MHAGATARNEHRLHRAPAFPDYFSFAKGACCSHPLRCMSVYRPRYVVVVISYPEPTDVSAEWPLQYGPGSTSRRSIRRGPRVSRVPKIWSECSSPCGVRRAVGGAKRGSTTDRGTIHDAPHQRVLRHQRGLEWMRVSRNGVRGAQDGTCPARWQSCLGGLPSPPKMSIRPPCAIRTTLGTPTYPAQPPHHVYDTRI